MRFGSVFVALFGLGLAVASAGCATPYTVKLDGDVQGTDKDTPRVVRTDIHWAAQAQAMRSAGGRHLHALTDATVTVGLQFKSNEKPKGVQTIKVDSQSAAFHFEASGESKDGALTGVLISVRAPGRAPVERVLAAAPDVPFEEVVMAVLDEGVPNGPSAPAPTPDPSKTAPAAGGK